jgi:precorrin-2 methylase
MNKLKFGIVAVAGVAILISIAAYFQARLREKDEALVAQTDRIAQLEAENERLSNAVVVAKSSVPQGGRAVPGPATIAWRGRSTQATDQ